MSTIEPVISTGKQSHALEGQLPINPQNRCAEWSASVLCTFKKTPSQLSVVYGCYREQYNTLLAITSKVRHVYFPDSAASVR